LQDLGFGRKYPTKKYRDVISKKEQCKLGEWNDKVIEESFSYEDYEGRNEEFREYCPKSKSNNLIFCPKSLFKQAPGPVKSMIQQRNDNFKKILNRKRRSRSSERNHYVLNRARSSESRSSENKKKKKESKTKRKKKKSKTKRKKKKSKF